ncbi:hypothetical protein SAMN05421788_104436 [Filimonas lacunae]|uniref:Capsule assembly protein Wzi n=1 Tax=Filimonas lacunae TaxID=477680 RepID=A0A173MRA9_9BACT|nr:hypothetical protein [Filimonas lacunae]BAV10194.1 hypothetical protein FLA_6254 [Filimonas lacunae]SIT18395.1 hypothetical protein SAMN05421788_104436 [Filimonas lacunae]
MQGTKKILLLSVAITMASTLFSQSDYISLGTKQYQLLDRLDIKLRNDSILGYTTTKPYNRQKVTARIAELDSIIQTGTSLPIDLSKVDLYNIKRLLLDNSEWAPAYLDSFPIKKPVFKTFYKDPGHMYAVNSKDFTLRVDPLLNLQYGSANDGTGSIYVNARGISFRGTIANKLGFYASVQETQELDPGYVRDFEAKYQAVPGQGYYKHTGSKAFDYTDARGGITFNSGKHFDFVFGFDKLFIGNGFRSLFLSDFSNSYLFFKINTRVWKFNYQNIFAEQTAPFTYAYGDNLRPKKYMAAHHLSFQAAKWINIGLFESISFGRSNGFALSYLNPVIFYREIERNEGSPDKASVGLDFKINASKRTQFYGQLLINELVMNEILHYGRGDWRNKQALQLGVKYIDALGVKNLDLQAEANIVRPFVYTHYDSAGSFTHYNQPLAHPLGANFKEFILLAKYQPLPKLYLQGKIIAYKQGLDSAGYNFGSNLFLNYESRVRDQQLFIGSGTPVNSVTLGFNASYEIFENMFVDFNSTYRTYNIQKQEKTNVFYYTIGFRVNLQRREFDF